MSINGYSELYLTIKLIFAISILFGLIGFSIAFISQFEIKFLKYRKVGLILIFNSIFFGFLTYLIYTNLMEKIRNEVKMIVNDADTKIYQRDDVFGKFSSKELKNEIHKLKDYNVHHSDYGECMNLTIVNKKIKSFHLMLCRDTQISNEYWVFTDKYDFMATDDEIGRIHSDILN